MRGRREGVRRKREQKARRTANEVKRDNRGGAHCRLSDNLIILFNLRYFAAMPHRPRLLRVESSCRVTRHALLDDPEDAGCFAVMMKRNKRNLGHVRSRVRFRHVAACAALDARTRTIKGTRMHRGCLETTCASSRDIFWKR